MQKKCVIIVADSQDEDGEYIPVMVIEGESGYRPLDGGKDGAPWKWGKDKDEAMDRADEYTIKLGTTLSEADEIVFRSVFPFGDGDAPEGARRMMA